jgi:hypothetical protein
MVGPHCASADVPAHLVASLDTPFKLFSNPTHDRSKPSIWNDGSNRRKFICFEPMLLATASSSALVGDAPEALSVESAQLAPETEQTLGS